MIATEPLDAIVHADLRLAAGYGAQFGDAVSTLPVFVNEFAQVAREYPILFIRTADGSLQAIALLGLAKDENLFVQDGLWDARYIPAVVRRGPFRVGPDDQGSTNILVDRAHPRLTNDQSGLPLFLQHGGHAPALNAGIEALQILRTGYAAVPAMTEALDAAQLVQPAALEVRVSDSRTVKFDNYLSITPERIDALDDVHLCALSRAQVLQPAVHAAASLARINDLIGRALARGSP